MPTPRELVTGEVKHLVTFNYHPRPWHMPLMAAIALSFPIVLGAYFGQLAIGLLASLGSMVFLNLPYEGTLLFRLTQVLACSFGYVACFAVGLIAHMVPILTLPLVFFVTFWVALFSRYFRLLPPAGVFILMATAIALFMPIPPAQVPFYVGLIAFGCLFSGIVASVYSLVLLAKNPTVKPPVFKYQQDMLTDSVLIALISSLSLAVALWLNMPRPYWVLVSCYVVIIGMTFRSMWMRQVQRIVGTAVGMLVAWLILWLNPTAWGVAATMFGLVFLIETLVMRNYAFAAVFITPLTILMAEYSNPTLYTLNASMAIHEAVILSRFLDTALGCVIGMLGGVVMHSTYFRPKFQALEQRFFACFNPPTTIPPDPIHPTMKE